MDLPVGFLFVPTDEEIICSFLTKKVKGERLPHELVQECDLYGDKEPWKLFDKHTKTVFYVFVKLKKNNNGTKTKRTAGCGTWDGQNTRKIYGGQGRRPIGFKKLLVFQVPRDFRSEARGKGHWIMSEYSINPKDDYVLCKIRNKDLYKEERPHITKTCLKVNARKFSSLFVDLEHHEDNHPTKRRNQFQQEYDQGNNSVDNNIYENQGAVEGGIFQYQDFQESQTNNSTMMNLPDHIAESDLLNLGEGFGGEWFDCHNLSRGHQKFLDWVYDPVV